MPQSPRSGLQNWQDGYVVNLTEAQLKDAPHGDTASTMDWTDPVFTSRIDNHYRRTTRAAHALITRRT